MVGSALGDWAFKWVWSSDGVGNFTDDLVLLAVASFFVPRIRRWWIRREKDVRAETQRLHDELKAHITLHHQRLHDHIEAATGVKPPEDTP